MTLQMREFVDELRKSGIQLRLEGTDQLRFKAKPGAMTPSIKERVVANKPGLIEYLQQFKPVESATADMVRISREGSVPISFSQERLWITEQMSKGTSVFLVPTNLEFIGPFSVLTWEAAMHCMIQRHETLRFRFIAKDGKPEGDILDTLIWQAPVIDISGLDETAQRVFRNQFALVSSNAPLELHRAPLWRMTLVRTAPQRTWLFSVEHHAICDHISASILTRDLALAYNGLLHGQAPSLPDISLQYADFAAWQRQSLAKGDLKAQLEYWAKHLEGLEALELPTDRPRQPVQRHLGGAAIHAFSPDLTRKLQEISSGQQVSMFMICLALYQSLLFRYSQQSDIAAGTSIGHRKDKRLDHTLGMFVNLLVLRTSFKHSPNFHELLQRVRHASVAAFDNQDAPFDKLVDLLVSQRDASRHPLVQHMMVYLRQVETKQEEIHGNLSISPLKSEGSVTSKADLTLEFMHDDDRIHLSLEFDTDLFDQKTADRLLHHLVQLATHAVETREKPIHQLDLMTPEEKRVLIEQSRRNEEREDASIAQAVWDMARQHPSSIAISDGKEDWTYDQLVRRAAFLSRELKAVGAKSGDFIGVCLTPQLSFSATVLAILSIGCAYVPLNSGDPHDRLSFIIGDTGLSCLIAEDATIDALPAYDLNFLNVFMLDDYRGFANKIGDTPQCPNALPAYMVYTSGTTGTPKGVVVSHRNVLSLINDDVYLQITPEHRIAQASNLAFDALTFEIWTALCKGARLCLIEKAAFLSENKFSTCLKARKIDVLFITTALFNQFAHSPAKPFADLTYLLFGGELVTPSCVAAVLKDQPPGQLLHVYGPTETTTFASFHPVSAVRGSDHNVPLGGPVAETSLHVLDRGFQLLPAGINGELFIGGKGLAYGYWNRSSLTAERFIPNPFDDAFGARLYRTGDIVRRDEKGAISFIGRNDHQVKVRGFRIELGEIQVALMENPAIGKALVIANRPANQQGAAKRLIAYLEMVGDLDIADIRERLQKKIPQFMMPAYFISVETFPLNRNGKIDVKRLPEPEDIETLSDDKKDPSTPHEWMLSELWAEVLGHSNFGVNHNFFESGGDSLLSIQLRAKVRQQGFDFDLSSLFENGTISGLAADLRPYETDEDTHEFSMISEEDCKRMPEHVEDAYPLSSLQMGLLFHSELDEDSGFYHVSFLFKVELDYNVTALQAVMDGLVKRHTILRTAFDFESFSQPLQLVHKPMPMPVRIIPEAVHKNDPAYFRQWQEEDKRTPFQLEPPPLFRLVVFQSKAGFHCGMSFNHAIIDGWSQAAMASELLINYEKALQGETIADAALQSSYRDFVKLEQQIASDPAALEFWKTQLDSPPRPELPRWPNRFLKANEKVGGFDAQIDKELRTSIQSRANEMGVPMKTLLAAAHLRALSIVTGNEDVITGLSSHGRPETTDSEKILGLFVHFIPLRMQLRGLTWRDLVNAVGNWEKSIQNYRRFPLADMVRSIDHGSLFQTIFNYTHFHVYRSIAETNLGDAAETVSIESDTHFDLSLDAAVNPVSGDLRLTVTYRPDLVAKDQAELYGRALVDAIKAIDETPDLPLGPPRLPQDHPVKLTSSQTLEADDHSVLDSFAASVRRVPNNLAVWHPSAPLTYQALELESKRLAVNLATRGIGPGKLVGLCFIEAHAWIVSMIAVWKTGAAWAAMRANDPPARLGKLLDSASVDLVLLDQPNHPVETTGVPCLLWSDPAPAEQPAQPIDHRTNPQELAYVLFTSGTTGEPKPVAIPHAALHNHQVAAVDRYDLTERDKVLQFCDFAFDASLEEVFPALASGASIIPATAEARLSPKNLNDFIASQAITVIDLPTAYWHAWAQDLGDTGPLPPSLRLTIVGGEAPNPKALAIWQEKTPSNSLWCNSYGPTEATIINTTWFASSNQLAEPIPLGTPLQGRTLALVDKYLRSVPHGVSGEICLGGKGLAWGYLKRPRETAKRFVPDPNAAEPGARIYLTGDLGQTYPDGTVVHAGRIDDQIKIQGYRIEPREIESHLSGLPFVHQALVRPLNEGQATGLIAYILLPEAEAAKETEHQRQCVDHLRRHVQAAAIPQQYIFLTEFPRRANGKVDFKALPKVATGVTRQVELPVGETEKQIAEVWKRVLHLDEIDRHANFFDSGGHSLAAIQIARLLRNLVPRDVSVADLLHYPTIAQLAEHMDGRSRNENLIALRDNADGPAMVWIHPIGGHIHWYRHIPALTDSSIAIYAMRSPLFNNPEFQPSSLEDLAASYLEQIEERLGNRFRYLAGWSVGGAIAFEMARQWNSRNPSLEKLLLIDSATPEFVSEESNKLASFLIEIGIAPHAIQLPSDKNIAWPALHRKLVNNHLLPQDTKPEELARWYDAYETNDRLYQHYHPRALLGSTTTILARASKTISQLADMPNTDQNVLNTFGWQPFSEKVIQVQDLDGDHYTILKKLNPILKDFHKIRIEAKF